MRASQGWRSHLPVRGKQHPNGSPCAAAPAPPAAAAAAPPPSRAGACPVRGAPGPGPTPAAHSAATCWRPRQVARLSAAPAGAPARSPPAHRFRLPVLTGWPTLAGRQWLAGRACQVSSFAATYARCRVLPPPMPGVAATAGGAAPGRYRGVGVLDTLVRIVRDWHCHTLDLQQLPLAEGAWNANCPNSCHTRQRPRGEEAI